MDPVSCFRECRTGVAQIRLVRDGELVGGGSGFLVDGGLATNSHVVRGLSSATLAIRFEDTDPQDHAAYIRIALADVLAAESPADQQDFAYLRMDAPEFEERHRFEFIESERELQVGEQVGFMGYPFSMHHLTSHLAFVSSVHESNGTWVFQLDGSVNAGNSGGPLVDVTSGKVVGIVTRAHTGLVEEQFRELIQALRHNQQVLSNTGGASISIGGIDPVESLVVSQAIMERIARDLYRSANVGIGFAFSARYLRDAIG